MSPASAIKKRAQKLTVRRPRIDHVAKHDDLAAAYLASNPLSLATAEPA